MTESSFRRLLLRFALIPLIAICGFLAVLGFQIRQIAVRRLTGSQATTVLLESEGLQKSLTDEETGIRGFLAAKDPVFLEPYRAASTRFGSELSTLRDAAARSPSLSEKITAISNSYEHFNDINQKLLARNFSDNALPGLLEQQRQAMDTLRAEFAAFNDEQTNIRETNRQQVTALLAELPVIAIGGGVFLAALLLWHSITVFQGITRAFRKQLDETEIQRDSLQTTLQSIGDGVLVCDNSGNITILNPTAETLTGWSQNQAIGRPLSEVFRIINENTRLPIESPADKARRLNTAVTLENHTILVRKDGAEIPIDDSAAPIRNRDSSLLGVVLVFRSVAERRRTANLIRQSQQRLNSIYNTTLEYIGILTPDGKLLEANRASLEFANNTREEVIGKNFWECPWFTGTPAMPEAVRAAVQAAATGQSTRTEMALLRPSGETIHFDFSLTPVVDSDGNVIYLVPEGRDISELKRAEHALVQSEKLAAVGRLASSIAHEINNPLEAVTNLLYLSRNHSASPEVQEYLKLADHELRRVSVIANQTLRFHRQTSNPEPTQAADLFSTVLTIYEGRLHNSGVQVETSYRTSEPIVCFAGDVRQVLNNLVGNAIDAMSSKGGRLLIRSNLSRNWSTDSKGVVFTIADTGAGIAPADLTRIFEPFFTTKGIGGTGLGLWISKEVVSRHNGTLKVRSNTVPNSSGTVFRFFLPFP